LVELGLEEYEENEFVFNTITEVQEIFFNSFLEGNFQK
jgi:hypothetical protein